MDHGQLEIAGFRRERGLLWPDYDTRCAEVTFAETVANVVRVHAHQHAARRRVAVQAGGNCGQLVRELACIFERVYTFEPDARNFIALTVNTALYQNVHRFQAVLGYERGRGVSLGDGDAAFIGKNCGALYAAGGGPIPTMRIDDLGLPFCDLIFLDVEGSEHLALIGARETIERCRTLVIFENKGHGAKFYGELPDAAERWLEAEFNYQVLERSRLDTVMGPA